VEVISTPADNGFLKALAALKIVTGLNDHINSKLKQNFKYFQEGFPKHILEKNLFFRRMGDELWVLDGTVFISPFCCFT
jgi:hypothetical protein